MYTVLLKLYRVVFQALRTPRAQLVVLLLLTIGWFFSGKSITQNVAAYNPEGALELLVESDPEARDIMARLDDEQRVAMLVAAAAAEESGRPRSEIQRLADEMNTFDGLPYSARLVEVIQESGLRDAETQTAFFEAHATACQMLELGDPALAHEYVTQLQSAMSDPTVSKWVRDDPLALVIWTRLDDPYLLEVYHQRRDWLADAIAAIDPGASFDDLLIAVRKHSDITEALVKDAEYGALGLAIVRTHGDFLTFCRVEHNLDPREVAAVIFCNPTLYAPDTLTPEQTSYMATALKNVHDLHPDVYAMAQLSPLAMNLFFDAPDHANALLDMYGPDLVQLRIYSISEDPAFVRKAAASVVEFGDLALYILGRYGKGSTYDERVVDLFTHPEVGLAAVPFIVRYEDRAFAMADDDIAWIKKYFNNDGSPREDRWEWIQYVPGGSAVQAARNVANGYPITWEEMGWAAVDVVDVALVVSTFGGSKAASAAAKAGLKAGKAAKPAKAVAKNTDSLKVFREAVEQGVKSERTLLRRAAQTAKVIGATVDIAWGAVGLAGAGARKVLQAGSKAVDVWKSLPQKRRFRLKRAALCVGLFVTITERTLPNAEAIGEGLGGLIADAAAGTVRLLGETLAETFIQLSERATGGSGLVRRSAYWFILAVLIIFTITLSIKSLPKPKAVNT